MSVTSDLQPVPEQSEPPSPQGPSSRPGPTPRSGRRLAGAALTVLAAALVLLALVIPDDVTHLSGGSFLRLPAEALVAAALVLVLPDRSRSVAASALGALLGLITLIKIVDLGFYESLDRPFDLVLDWSFFGPGLDFVTKSVGRAGAIAVVAVIAVLALTLVALLALSVRRLARLLAARRRPAAGGLAVLSVAWLIFALLGTELAAGEPVAAHSAATLGYDRVKAVYAGLHDKEAFAKEAAVDRFAATPNDQLLTGLKGQDVILAFVESYGRSAVEDPKLNPPVDAALADGDRRLKAAGYSAESGFLTSPTSGGGSWLAHSTLLSGLWINNQQRYDNLVKTHRLTLTGAFDKADWRTVAEVPAVTRAWPEGAFYGYDKIYAVHDFGYQGPSFSWAPIPDQFTLHAFQQAERGPDRAPVMAEMALVSSHAPWAPIPSLLDWDALGDGSVYAPMKNAQDPPSLVWRDADRVRVQYAQSIAYSLDSLITYVQKYGGDNLVLVFLGDHQPAPIVTSGSTNRDVPITIVAHDRAVLDKVGSWGWTPGLKPGPQAPVWPMSAFRDKFLTAFGSGS